MGAGYVGIGNRGRMGAPMRARHRDRRQGLAKERDSGFAAGLRAERNRADMTQEELADAVGVSTSSVINWESGEYMPSLATTIRIADVLGCTLEQLAGRA